MGDQRFGKQSLTGGSKLDGFDNAGWRHLQILVQTNHFTKQKQLCSHRQQAGGPFSIVGKNIGGTRRQLYESAKQGTPACRGCVYQEIAAGLNLDPTAVRSEKIGRQKVRLVGFV